jgi:hypothetical protein
VCEHKIPPSSAKINPLALEFNFTNEENKALSLNAHPSCPKGRTLLPRGLLNETVLWREEGTLYLMSHTLG